MSSEDDSELETTDEETDVEEDNTAEQKDVLKSTKKVPQDVELEDEIFDICFHPQKNVIASGEISGKVCIYSVSNDENKKIFENTNHTKACRNLTFSSDGERLYTCSKDKSLQVIDLNTGNLVTRMEKAHEKAINCMKVFDNFFTTGSDDGVVKMWDTRTFTVVAEFPDFKDYISDMAISKDNKHLLCTSGDGYLSVLNLKKKVIEHTSDQLDEELLSLVIMKNGTKVVCGGGDGVLNIFNWGEWGDISDRVPMEKDSIDVVCQLNDDIVCTGVGNGRIHCWYLHPHKHIGSIGFHGKMGIQSLSLSSDEQILASAAGEKTVKFWDVSEVHNTPEPSAREKNNLKRKLEKDDTSHNDFFDGL